MNNSDAQEFKSTVSNYFEVIGKDEPSKAAMRLWWQSLRDYDVSAITQAFSMNLAQNKFRPTPADIIALLETGNQHLSADEAWALCPKNENTTVVWTDEIASAFGVCSELLADGDKIGARMAFKAAYDRACDVSRLQRKRPRWIVSIGHHKEEIEATVKQAVLLGRISNEASQKYLIAKTDAGFVGKLLTGTSGPVDSEVGRKNTAKILELMGKPMRSKTNVDKAEPPQSFEDRRKAAIAFCTSKLERNKRN